MIDETNTSTRLDPIGRVLFRLARGLVITGGACLTAAGLLTVASVIGRYFFNAPIPGDFELVEMACAVAVFSFLPYCQLKKGNVLVDFFTYNSSPRTKGILDSISAIIYSMIAILLTWRLWVGGLDFFHTNEQTVILQIPRAYVFIFIMPSMALLVVVTLYTIWQHFYAASEDHDPLEGEI
ncbi:MAG: TRAP transporter small permease [Rhodospirillaceae bacterium]|jgi:TRAP-type C4-dicarboxylate transport system permease small subunit|nr:TRAP transporter small permease [Rhodospirillaceae bacterium]MBT4937995.1 TRAP transporter small permease [Rhodospirillaceae bacterium]MBT5938855.1 TRAP transporter small permease [Rhodospirillaceae bacterium]MBT7265276.1 TRAP transporter small permease [Rhodospirillaceae bacterium]